MHPSAEIDLAKLLGSIEPEAFFRDAWEKRHLAVRRNDPDYYHGLFSRSDVDSVIAFTRSRFVDPDRLRPRSFVQGWLPDDEPFTRYYPDLPAVHRAFAHGKTLILQQALAGAGAADVRFGGRCRWACCPPASPRRRYRRNSGNCSNSWPTAPI